MKWAHPFILHRISFIHIVANELLERSFHLFIQHKKRDAFHSKYMKGETICFYYYWPTFDLNRKCEWLVISRSSDQIVVYTNVSLVLFWNNTNTSVNSFCLYRKKNNNYYNSFILYKNNYERKIW